MQLVMKTMTKLFCEVSFIEENASPNVKVRVLSRRQLIIVIFGELLPYAKI